MKNDKMSNNPQAGPSGLGNYPKGPTRVKYVKEVY